MTMLWNLDIGWPGEYATRIAVGPRAAKSQGCEVASVIAPATSMRIAEMAAPHTALLPITRADRPRRARTGGRRSGTEAGAIRVGPVTAGVGTVGVIMYAGQPRARRVSPC